MRRRVGNPLVGFERPEGMSWRDVPAPEAPLWAPNAETRFREVLRNVPFDLTVLVVRPGTSEAVRQEVHRTVAQLRPEGEALGVFYAVTGSASRIQALSSDLPKWDEERISPMTPFVVLHRIYDVIDQTFPEENFSDDLDEDVFYGTSRLIRDAASRTSRVCAGVDTAAGRHQALADDVQAMADLFAKWCITGRVAFDPHVIPEPREGFVKTPKYMRDAEKWIQARVAAVPQIKKHFERIAARLRQGGAGAIL